jgi:hypothetical protein
MGDGDPRRRVPRTDSLLRDPLVDAGARQEIRNG